MIPPKNMMCGICVTCLIMQPLGIYQIVCCSFLVAIKGDDSRPAKKATTEAAPKESMRHLARKALSASRTSTSSRRDRDHEIWG